MKPLKRAPGFVFWISLLLAAASAPALEPPLGPQDFAGTWQATFQGKPFLSLNLQVQNGKVTGTVSHTSIQLNSAGELTGAEAKDGADRIVGAKFLDDHTARFTTLNDDTQDTSQYEMKLNSPDEAEIHLLGTAQNTAAPKPWKLARQPATATGEAAAATGTSAAGVSPAPANGNAAAPASGSENSAQNIKAKLATAAQIWLSGQFGTEKANPASANSATTTSDAAAKATPAVGLKISDAPLDAGLQKDIDGLPRRVRDQFENLGDMVNFVLIGSESQMQAALESANWHLADTDTREAAVKAVLQTYEKKDYLAMPMSTLYLFGRKQDFGYEMAEPYAMVASRHHFRIWKAPFTWNGQTVWVGAGTHDIGFEKDVRNGKVTHKIDPAVDGERENIGSSLQKSGVAKTVNYYLPSNPVQGAKNATGGGYHSDGRILVIQLQAPPASPLTSAPPQDKKPSE